MKKAVTEWQIYRTRFLIKARQLTEPLVFVDTLGREHKGRMGDYLVESSDGTRRIAPQKIFEDVYVLMGLNPGRLDTGRLDTAPWDRPAAPRQRGTTLPMLPRRTSARPIASA